MEGSLVAGLAAGVAGGGLLLGVRLVSMRVDPRPCWEKNDCALRRANPATCQTCPVYVDRDVPIETYLPEELNLPPLRRFDDEQHAA